MYGKARQISQESIPGDREKNRDTDIDKACETTSCAIDGYDIWVGDK